jgi:UDP-N-acetylglucosamine 1-carboxyvinyltransferase
MARFRIIGKQPLNGSVTISGRKNAALKLLAATLLTTGTVTLKRIPRIGDVDVMLQILAALGAHIERSEDSVIISTANVTTYEIPYDLGRKLRASLVLVGPLLARFGKASFPHPGGCVIGKRSIEPHLDGFRQLGAQVEFDGTTYRLSGPLHGKLVYLKEKSVTGTENLLMASVTAEGTTHIFNAAGEEHITNLANLLRKLGYSVSGDGSASILIHGQSGISSQSAEEEIIADEIEVGTFAVASLITGGTITLKRVGNRISILPILDKLDDFNAQYHYDEESQELTLLPSPDLRAADIQTNPWPGFFPDLQSPFAVLATQSKGQSLIHDWMYEGRLNFVDLLERMGANITVCDPHRVIVSGPTPLQKTSTVSPDLRAGAALVLAALAAEGESIVEHVELIDRGYVELDERLRNLGAQIIREA